MTRRAPAIARDARDRDAADNRTCEACVHERRALQCNRNPFVDAPALVEAIADS